MDSRDAITVAGLPIATRFLRALDPAMEIEMLVEEGEQLPAGSDLMQLRGIVRAMLTAERSALNTIQHLSGIATMTRRYVAALEGTGVTQPRSEDDTAETSSHRHHTYVCFGMKE